MLDNPIWHSLSTRHAGLAIGRGYARRYPPQVTPFIAVSSEEPQAEADLRSIVQPDERVGILAVIPPMEEHWTLEKAIRIHQFVWPENAPANEDPEAVRLTESDIAAMLELTSLVYPAYFRPETARLGDYYGMFEGGMLCAMAGIRMSMEGYSELSAICTHPDHRGRGYAGRLTTHLVHQIQSRGDRAFLHTEFDNHAAQALYRKLGFHLRAELPFRVLTRTA